MSALTLLTRVFFAALSYGSQSDSPVGKLYLFHLQAHHQDIPYVLLLVINVMFRQSDCKYASFAFSCTGPSIWNSLLDISEIHHYLLILLTSTL